MSAKARGGEAAGDDGALINMNTTARSSDLSAFLRSLAIYLAGIDWLLLLATGFLVTVGLCTLKFSQHNSGFFDKQIDFMWAGLFLLAVFSRVPYIFWTNKFAVPIMYIVNLGFLLAVMIKGHSAMGAQRWLSIGPITLQPSELAKLVVIFTLSAWFSRRPVQSFWDIFKAAAIIVPTAVLVFKQPDLGTSLTFGAVFLGTTYWAGATVSDILVLASPLISLILSAVDKTYCLYFIAALGLWLLCFWRVKSWRWWLRIFLILVILAGNYAADKARPHLWGMLKGYQQKRLTSFVNPYEDPRGSGYHILQSLIAIGSGGMQGTGLGKGNQSQGAFIPERHTDFIFAVLGEELGFKITALIIAAYSVICVRALMIAYQSRGEPTGSVLAIGLMCMFLFHVFLNIGMTMGIMPVAGVPLPFLSYGGTAMIVDLVSIGLLLSINLYNPPPRKDVRR